MLEAKSAKQIFLTPLNQSDFLINLLWIKLGVKVEIPGGGEAWNGKQGFKKIFALVATS